MRACVIVFPGSNCDRDVKVALARWVGAAPAMIWHGDRALPETDLIVRPGGFAHGDYLRAGAMAAHSPVMRAVVRAADAGTPVLAICNGFQIAIEAGLLPGALIANANLKFVCSDVHIRVENVDTPFTAAYRAGQVTRLPVAHQHGNYFVDPATLAELEDGNRVVFRYCRPDGASGPAANPNGSTANIAGIVNQAGNVLGLMPHPERLADPALGGDDGRLVFQSLAAVLR